MNVHHSAVPACLCCFILAGRCNLPSDILIYTSISTSFSLVFRSIPKVRILGREVAVLVNEKKAPGSYEVKFDGSHLATGVYFYRLEAGAFVVTKKMVVLR